MERQYQTQNRKVGMVPPKNRWGRQLLSVGRPQPVGETLSFGQAIPSEGWGRKRTTIPFSALKSPPHTIFLEAFISSPHLPGSVHFPTS